ncbi:MAG: hypothetical protein WAN28_14975, partial [Terracidiphilus sp.]
IVRVQVASAITVDLEVDEAGTKPDFRIDQFSHGAGFYAYDPTISTMDGDEISADGIAPCKGVDHRAMLRDSGQASDPVASRQS